MNFGLQSRSHDPPAAEAIAESLSTLQGGEWGPQLLATFVWDEGMGSWLHLTASGWSWKDHRDGSSSFSPEI